MLINRNKSILFRVSILIVALCLTVMFYASYQTHLSWMNYQTARKLGIVQVVTQYFSDALKNFMFERGRMRVVLSTDQPISDENRDFINLRREAANESFESGFQILAKFYPEEADLLRRQYASFAPMRETLDLEAAKPLEKRDLGIRDGWFSACTDYINTVIKKIVVIREISCNNIFIFNCFDVIVDSLLFRSIVGNESSVITSALASGETLDHDFYTEIMTMRGESMQFWSQLETTVEIVGSEPLSAALEDVRAKYYWGLRPEQDRLINLAYQGQLDDDSANEIANLSVPALNSIFRISEEAIEEIRKANKAILRIALNGLIGGLMHFLAGAFIVVTVPLYFKKRFVGPLNDIVAVLEDISGGKTDGQVPHTQRNDEVGKLAFGAAALKSSILEEKAIKQKLEETVLQLEELSVKDPLTGLFNRRYMKERFDEIERLYKRNGRVFSVIMADVDNFKSFNDRYGHDSGDNVLVYIAATLSSHCRESDILSRWGGEEFLFLLPDTNQSGAITLAERIRKNLAERRYESDEFQATITMTFGVAEYSLEKGIKGTIRSADAALLRGKANGRNRVEA